MRMSIVLALLLQAAITMLPGTLQAESSRSSLAAYNWAVDASPNLVDKPPRVEIVRKFMEQQNDEERSEETRICSYRFADMGHNGNLTLLVTRQDGGHGGCGTLYIVDRTPTGFVQHFASGSVWGFGDVRNGVRDIDHDGHLEIIVYHDLTAYEGAMHCLADWPVIYAWDGADYANVSAQPRLRPFYRREIKSLEKRTDIPADCRAASVYQIERFLGAPPTTGLDDAAKWATSSDPFVREFAAGVLANISTPEAADHLRKLVHDPNPQVSTAAKWNFAYCHFEKKLPNEKDVLESNADTMRPADSLYAAGAWHLVAPMMKSGKIDPNADDRKWMLVHGFDSKEQCQIGLELNRQSYAREGPNFQYMLQSKCVFASSQD